MVRRRFHWTCLGEIAGVILFALLVVILATFIPADWIANGLPLAAGHGAPSLVDIAEGRW